MAILQTEMKIMYSGSSSKNGPGGPQGGVISTNAVPEQTLSGGITIGNTIFDDVTTQEAASGKVEYFCGYVKNTNGTLTAQNIKIWQSSITPGSDKLRFGYSGVAANSHDTLLTSTNTPVYQVPLSTSFSSLDNDRNRAGFYVTSESAPIYNKAITLVELYLMKVGSPTGTLNVRQRSRNSETIRTDFGTLDVSTINSTTPTLYQFSAPANTFKTQDESVITVEYGGGTSSNYVQVSRKAGSPIPFMHVINYDGSQWRNVSDFDLCGNLYTSGVAGDTIAPTNVTFQHPVNRETAIPLPNLAPAAFVPFWIQRTVPANSANYNENTSEFIVEFDTPP